MRRAGFFAEPLGKDKAKAVALAEDLNARWDADRKGETVTAAPLKGTVADLVVTLRNSVEYSDKGRRTLEELDYALGKFLPVFGPTHVGRVTADHIRDYYDHLRETGSVHHAAKIMKWLRYLFGFAVRYGYENLSNNPTHAVRIKKPPPRTNVWTPTQVRAVMTKAEEMARPCIRLAVLLAYDTGLRQGDILALTWARFDTESLRLTQQKTGQDQRVPLWPETIAVLETFRRSGGVIALATAPIIRAPHGRAYGSINFAKRFREICQEAGIPDELQFRDLRRTASKERAEAGATEYELAAGGGWSIERGSKILDTYNPRSYETAIKAQEKRRRMLDEGNE